MEAGLRFCDRDIFIKSSNLILDLKLKINIWVKLNTNKYLVRKKWKERKKGKYNNSLTLLWFYFRLYPYIF